MQDQQARDLEILERVKRDKQIVEDQFFQEQQRTRQLNDIVEEMNRKISEVN